MNKDLRPWLDKIQNSFEPESWRVLQTLHEVDAWLHTEVSTLVRDLIHNIQQSFIQIVQTELFNSLLFLFHPLTPRSCFSHVDLIYFAAGLHTSHKIAFV